MMTIDQMKKIVDDAPNAARYYCTEAKVYHLCDDLVSFDCCVSIEYLRTELTKHDTLYLEPADIPHGIIVLED